MRKSMTHAAALIGLAPALTATLMPAAAAPAGAPAMAKTTATTLVEINTGRGRLVTLSRPMTDLFVADDTIADVQVRSPTQLYVFGKKPGETTISATAKGGAVVYASTVRVGNNFDSIAAMLGLAMPDAKITATPMNGLVLLTGTVAAPADAAEAERLVQAYVGEGAKVLSRLRTATPLQVNLSVRIAEVSRSFVKNVGVNFATVDSTGGFKFGVARGASAGQFNPGGPLGTGFTTAPTSGSLIASGVGTTLGVASKLFGLNILGALDLAETIGQSTTLANPNLTALSGETGTFLAGGEIPIPISQGLGAVSVEFKSYGISLAYTPTVLADGRISMRVRPEVSQLDYSSAVTLGGTRIPGISSRRVETTLELGSGQSMVIGGLLQNNSSNSITKAPFLGDLPILGALFRSNGFQRNETELVIVITPYLVKPVDSQSQIVLPTDGYRTPADYERLVVGNVGGYGQSGARRPVPTMAAPPSDAPSDAPVGSAPVAPAGGAAMAPAPRPKKGSAPMPGFSN